MSTEVPFSIEELERIEPHLGDVSSGGRSYLSTYSFPTTISLTTVGDRVFRLEFKYASTPPQMGDAELIDDERNPGIALAFSAGIPRVLQVSFFSPIAFEVVRTLGHRLRAFARRQKAVAKRLSVELVASIMEGPPFLFPPPACDNPATRRT